MSARARYNERKRKMIDDAKAKPCVDCGNVYPLPAMDLHHTDPSTKLFNLSQYMTKGYDAISAEIAKCVPLCSNCHRIRTWNDRDTQMTLF